MIIVSTSSKPVMMSLSGQVGVETVSVRGSQGGNQILSLPRGMAGQTQTMMVGFSQGSRQLDGGQDCLLAGSRWSCPVEARS